MGLDRWNLGFYFEIKLPLSVSKLLTSTYNRRSIDSFNTFKNESKPTLQVFPMHRLQWEEAQQKHVILYPEGMVELNQSSAEILLCCDGTRNLDQIISDLEQKFATSGLKNDITAFLEVALNNGWVQQD